MSYKFSLVSNGTTEVVTVLVDGDLHPADSSHPNYQRILDAARAGDPDIIELFDVSRAVDARFKALSRRVSVSNGVIHLDGDPVHNTLTRQVLRFLEEGLDFKPLVNFFERVQANPNEHSREQLYSWLSGRDFPITKDGFIVAYKGVGTDGRSVHSGKAIVNGQVVRGRIPNEVGAVIEMPRSEVQHDPAIGCHTGLHVGTYGYASTFGSRLLTVEVDPADIVSVPTDCNAQKVRTCRYTVVEVSDELHTSAFYGDYEDDEDDDTWGDDEGYDLDEEADDVEPTPLVDRVAKSPWWKRGS
jgi:hypothetical protein